MVQFGGAAQWLQLLQQRQALELRRQEIEIDKQQQKFSNAVQSAHLQLAREARTESALESAIQRRLGEVRIKSEEAQLEAWESGARLLDMFQQKFGQAGSAKELEANMAATKDVLGSSRDFSGLRKIKGGMEAALGAIGKSFASSMDRFLASANIGDRLDMASLISSPGTESNANADAEMMEKARSIPGKILSEWSGAINALPDPKDAVDPVSGILPTDFARFGQSQLDTIKGFEQQLLDPRLQTPDSVADVAVFKSAISAKKQSWEESLALLNRVDRVREAAIRGVPVNSYSEIRDDLNAYYKIFDQRMVKYAPIGQAIQSMAWYAKTGFVPDELVSDLTNPVMFDQPDSAYRASALLQTLQLSGKDSTVVAINKSFKDNPKQMVLAQRINAWRDVNRGIEIQAFASGDPAVMADVVTQAYASSIQAMAASDQLAKGVTEDVAAKDSDNEVTANIGGSNVDIPRSVSPVTNRQIAIGLMHKSIPGWTKGSIASRFGYNELNNDERERLTDDFQWAYEQEFSATQDEVAAWTNADAILRQRWGDAAWGPRTGKSSPMPPKSLAFEQGIPLEDDIANAIARMQLFDEVISPYNTAKGTQVTFRQIVTTPMIGIDDKGTTRTGYHVAAQVVGNDGKIALVPLSEKLWFPDFRDESIPASMIQSSDARLIEQRQGSKRHEELLKRDERWYKAKQAYRDRPSPSTLRELRKSEGLMLDFYGVPPEEQ